MRANGLIRHLCCIDIERRGFKMRVSMVLLR